MAIPTMMLVFGMMVIGNLDASGNRDVPTDSRLNGTWVFNTGGTEIEMTLDNGNYKHSYVNVGVDHQEFTRGTYDAMEGTLVFRPTHKMNIGSLATQTGLESGKWYTIDEYKIAMGNYAATFGSLQDFINSTIEDAVSPQYLNYSVTNNSLTITTMYGENFVYIKNEL